jgi:DNA-binding Lrp family transcriptional regulator
VISQLSDVDNRMLRLLLDNEGKIPSHEISLHLKIPISTVQRRRKRLETDYLVKTYALDPVKFGFRRVDLLIYTGGGATIELGKELLKRDSVMSAVRTIGEHTIDLRVEVFVKDNGELLDLLEVVKGMEGVRDVVWTEAVETIGKKSPPDYFTTFPPSR